MNIPESPEVIEQRVTKLINLWLVVVETGSDDLIERLDDLITEILDNHVRTKATARALANLVIEPVLAIDIPGGTNKRTIEFEFDHTPEPFEIIAKDYLNHLLAGDLVSAEADLSSLFAEDDETEVLAFLHLLINLFWAST